MINISGGPLLCSREVSNRNSCNVHSRYRLFRWRRLAECLTIPWWLRTDWHLEDNSINAWEIRMRRWRTILSWEKGLPFQHLCKNTSGTPDIDRNIVLLPSEHYFRRTIVSRWNIAGHLRILYTSKAKITDLQGVDYQLLSEVKKRLHTLRSQFSLTRMLLGFC